MGIEMSEIKAKCIKKANKILLTIRYLPITPEYFK